MSENTAPQHLRKQPFESRVYTMDFGNLMSTGETISTVAVTSELRGGGSSTLSISSETISVQTILMTIGAGTNGKTYRVEVRVTTSGPQSLEGDGILRVSDK